MYVICFRNMSIFGAKCLGMEEEGDFIQRCLVGSHNFGPGENDEDYGDSNGSREEVIE